MSTFEAHRNQSLFDTGPLPVPGSLARGRALRPQGKVLPEYARSHNRSLVLQTLYQSEQLSRADLARETGLTRVTISDLVADLIDDGIVIECGQRESNRPGKPAVLLTIDRSAQQIIGLDLSAHDRFRGAVLDIDGKVIASAEVPLDEATGDAAIEKVSSLLSELIPLATAPILGVGVASPGVVDLSGTVLSAPNLKWENVPLQQILANQCNTPVLVANDGNTAALAEHTFGQAFSDLMVIKVGRGVGAGLLIDGTPLFGARFAAGEIGHVVVGTSGGARCACGKEGCLETWLSIPSLRSALEKTTAGSHDAADIAKRRKDVLRDAGEHLGIALAPVVAALNLSEIVLSGPEELLGGTLAQSTLEALRARTLPEFHGDLVLRMTEQGEDIALRGAAVLILAAQLGVS